MSAGGLSYSGLRTYGKATLPSVSAGLGSMNILRDPPKSIHTRRIDKVGQTSDITQWIQDSTDRSCENITQYARGVNPMVSVSYNNYGNNGGQRVNNNNGSSFYQKSAYLPYAIGSAGAVFRPPVLAQGDLLPLSRLPRNWTYAFTNKEFPDFSKKMVCAQPAEKTRQVKKEVIKASARPTRTFKIETPISEPFEVKYVIQNPIKVSANSGIKNMDIGRQEYEAMGVNRLIQNPMKVSVSGGVGGAKGYGRQEYVQPSGGINNENIKAFAQSQKSMQSYQQQENFSEKYVGKNLQNTKHSNVTSKIQSNTHVTPIEELIGMDVNMHIKDNINIDYETDKRMNGGVDYIHEELFLERNLPSYEATTNYGLNIHRNVIEDPYQLALENNTPTTSAYTNIGSLQTPGENTTQTSRDYKLMDKITPERDISIHQGSAIPQMDRYTPMGELESPRIDLMKKAVANFDGRYRHGFTINQHSNVMSR